MTLYSLVEKELGRPLPRHANVYHSKTVSHLSHLYGVSRGVLYVTLVSLWNKGLVEPVNGYWRVV